MGLVWVEYGGNSAQLTPHIIDIAGPICEGRLTLTEVAHAYGDHPAYFKGRYRVDKREQARI